MSRRLRYAQQEQDWGNGTGQEGTREHGERRERRVPLGVETIAGYEARGMRVIVDDSKSSEPGMKQQGAEFWYSAHLHEVVLMQLGQTTYTMSEIQESEPPREWFYPPQGYRIERGP